LNENGGFFVGDVSGGVVFYFTGLDGYQISPERHFPGFYFDAPAGGFQRSPAFQDFGDRVSENGKVSDFASRRHSFGNRVKQSGSSALRQ
jgi:hypothetical protein